MRGGGSDPECGPWGVDSLADSIQPLRGGDDRSGLIILAQRGQLVQTLGHLLLVALVGAFVLAASTLLLSGCRVGEQEDQQRAQNQRYRWKSTGTNQWMSTG